MPELNGSTRRVLKGKYVPLKIESWIGELLYAIIRRGCVRQIAFVAFASLEILAVLDCSAAPAPVSNTSDSGPGSLRDAIGNAANGDTITFAPGVKGTITLTSGELLITTSITIQGPGANNLILDGNASDRVLEIAEQPGLNVTISGLTIRNGRIVSGSSAMAVGGGILNPKGNTLTLNNCWVVNNTVQTADFTFLAQGGGIFNMGWLTLVACTVSGNSVIHDDENAEGGGIYSAEDTVLNLINCTVAGNLASGGGPGNGYGGGIYSDGLSFLSHCTISGNTAGGSGGGIGGGMAMDWYSATISIGNTIIALNTSTFVSPDLSIGWDLVPPPPMVTSLGYNLIGDTDGNSGWGTTDLTGADPMLAPLGNYGGPTPTIPPRPWSPAVDNGTTGGLSTDQRGLPRPVGFPYANRPNPGQGDLSDMGAVELQPLVLNLNTVALAPGDLVVSWYNDPGLVVNLLQSSSSPLIGSVRWVTNSLPVMTINGTNRVIITQPKGNMFFRLKVQ